MTNGSRDPSPALADDVGDVTIVVCSSCRRESDPQDQPRPGAVLAEDTRRAAQGTGIRVTHVACLGNCKRALSAAILKSGSWSYIFGGLEPGSGADLVAGAGLLAGSRDGLMPFRPRPASLKGGMVARIPPFDHLKDLP